MNGANICTGTISVSNPFDFNGQYRDDESGLYYLRARYYDPSTGQFMSRDPMVATTQQPYAFALDNPLSHTDPSGADSWWNDPVWSPYSDPEAKFELHGGSVGASNVDAYIQGASDLWNQALCDNTLRVRVDSNGFIRIFNKGTGRMGIYDENGENFDYYGNVTEANWQAQDASGYSGGETTLSEYVQAHWPSQTASVDDPTPPPTPEPTPPDFGGPCGGGRQPYSCFGAPGTGTVPDPMPVPEPMPIPIPVF